MANITDTDNQADLLRFSLSPQEIKCSETKIEKEFQNETKLLVYCDAVWDGVSCWPATLAGSLAEVPCLAELKGVKYDVNENASRECLENGTWSSWANYRLCTPLQIPDHEVLQVLWDMKDAATVYYVGYSLSLVALISALWIFFYFKDLRCLRNSIHANLMLTYFLIDVTWMLTASLQSSDNQEANKISCFLVILLTYLMGTNFFWMFVEGLYLFVLVVKTFSADNVKIQVYGVVGWGIPAIVAAIWAFVKMKYGHPYYETTVMDVCPWRNRDNYDYIFICPVVLVLLVNIVFLGKIMWVLITKLRASNSQESRQYRKAAKALLVLIPLLGVTYLLLIVAPSEHAAEVVFTYVQAALLSIQGFIVAVLYCFLNGEVQNSVRHHVQRWKVRRAIKRGYNQSFGSSVSAKHSFNSYHGRGVRDSCASFTTTTSIVNLHSTTVKAHLSGAEVCSYEEPCLRGEDRV